MSEYKIEEIPDIPGEILKAEKDKELAIFIGAGVSRLLGCKGWDELAQDLVKRCADTPKGDGTGTRCINFKEQETLSQETDHKKLITICYHILKDNNREDDFYEELEEALNFNNNIPLKHPDIYEEINRFHGLTITTNADKHVEACFESSKIRCKEVDFNENSIEGRSLYKIHGSIDDRDTLVFKVSDYVTRYQESKFTCRDSLIMSYT